MPSLDIGIWYEPTIPQPWSLGCILAWIMIWIVMSWQSRRHRRRWERQEQRRPMEQAITEDMMPEEDRAWWRHSRERQAAMQREARRRLGLPEEDPTHPGR